MILYESSCMSRQNYLMHCVGLEDKQLMSCSSCRGFADDITHEFWWTNRMNIGSIASYEHGLIKLFHLNQLDFCVHTTPIISYRILMKVLQYLVSGVVCFAWYLICSPGFRSERWGLTSHLIFFMLCWWCFLGHFLGRHFPVNQQAECFYRLLKSFFCFHQETCCK